MREGVMRVNIARLDERSRSRSRGLVLNEGGRLVSRALIEERMRKTAADEARQEVEAAARIQSVYRGKKVR